jgi:PhnB protein
MQLPPGFATVTPYFFAERADAFVEFLVNGLDGTEVLRHKREDGRIANAQVVLGTATVMVSEASERYPAMPASYYLYVDDADAALARALAHGATLESAVRDMPYGDRQGGVRDPWGNLWWISQRLVAHGYER